MKIEQTHKFYSIGFEKEEQDKEIWIDGKLTYTINKGLDNDDTNQVSPFLNKEVIQTVYITDKGTVQHNHVDDSFYFTNNAGRMVSYFDGELQEDVQNDFNEFITFANEVLTN
jgi:hypothetical protein